MQAIVCKVDSDGAWCDIGVQNEFALLHSFYVCTQQADISTISEWLDDLLGAETTRSTPSTFGSFSVTIGHPQLEITTFVVEIDRGN